jgi:hypothetical protein
LEKSWSRRKTFHEKFAALCQQEESNCGAEPAQKQEGRREAPFPIA